MIRFINLDTGRTFNGDWPYIHFFDGPLSTDLIHNHKLCFCSDKSKHSIIIEDDVNGAIKLLDTSLLDNEEVNTTVNDFQYKDINKLYKGEVVSNGVPYEYNSKTYYIHMIYFTASAPVPLEYHQNFFIDDDPFIIGADFYTEAEELKISLGNQGCDIPPTIQGALYTSNVHEEATDHILMNRKYKELLVDFINILGNRGSYKSLINSLKWFDYGDLIKIREFWKHDEWDRTIYSYDDFSQYVTDNIKNIISDYTKTTYLGLYCAMQNMSKDGDEVVYEKDVFLGDERFLPEPNPVLEQISYRWSKQDMAIKLALLGNYFSSYFLPIHMNLIHSTLESIVYTDAVKIINHQQISREDYIIHDNVVDCNIRDGQEFILENIEVNADDNTPFVNRNIPSKYADYKHVGVKDTHKLLSANDYYLSQTIPSDEEIEELVNSWVRENEEQSVKDDLINQVKKHYEYDKTQSSRMNGDAILSKPTDDQLKLIYLNRYRGVGVVVPLTFYVPVNNGDIIFKEKLSLWNEEDKDNSNGGWLDFDFEEVYESILRDPSNPQLGYVCKISFNLLLTKDCQHEIRMSFTSSNSRSYTKNLIINVVDAYRTPLTVYKIKSTRTTGSRSHNLFSFSHLPEMQQILTTQYLPVSKKDGLRLSRYIVIKDQQLFITVLYSGIFFEIYKDYMSSKFGINVTGYGPTELIMQTPVYLEFERALLDHIDPKNVKNGMKLLKKLYEYCCKLEADAEEKFKFEYLPTDSEEAWMNAINLNFDATYTGQIVRWFDNYFTRYSKVTEEGTTYYMFLANQFVVPDSNDCIGRLKSRAKEMFNKTDLVIRDDMIYIPQYHYLKPIQGRALKDFQVDKTEALCVVPNIKYLKNISEYEWEFVNATTLKSYKLPSIMEPFIASNDSDNRALEPGYYDIIFRYRLSTKENIQEVRLDSAFFIK